MVGGWVGGWGQSSQKGEVGWAAPLLQVERNQPRSNRGRKCSQRERRHNTYKHRWRETERETHPLQPPRPEHHVQQAPHRPSDGKEEQKHNQPEHGEDPEAEAPDHQVERAAEADAAPPHEQRRRRDHHRRQAGKSDHLLPETEGGMGRGGGEGVVKPDVFCTLTAVYMSRGVCVKLSTFLSTTSTEYSPHISMRVSCSCS